MNHGLKNACDDDMCVNVAWYVIGLRRLLNTHKKLTIVIHAMMIAK